MTEIVASFAVPATDADRVCRSIRAIVPDAFDGSETWISPMLGGGDVFVAAWRTNKYFERGVRKAFLDVVGDDYCLMEILSDGATYNKLGKGWLEPFFVAKRYVRIADDFSFDEYMGKLVEDRA